MKTRKNIFVLVWLAVALVVAFTRSLWCDEMIRYGQTQLGLMGGLKNLFTEPSPFAPGEIVLNFLASKLSFLPLEIWGRLPGVLWGALAVYAVASIGDVFFALLMVFSVSLMTLAAEMRPYGALVFSGAWALKILVEKPFQARAALGLQNRFENAVTLFAIFFGHLYGICFVALALFFKRRWRLSLLGFGFAALIVLSYKISSQAAPVTPYSFTEIARQTLGTLANPHKAALFALPLFFIGAVSLVMRNPKLFVKLALLLSATVLGPIGATMSKGYFFVPRQTAAGVAPFLFLVALGVASISEKLKTQFARSFLKGAVLVGIGILPFFLCIAMRRPPYPNQPLHRFNEIAKQAIESGAKTIVITEPCNREGLNHYLSRHLKSEPVSNKDYMQDGIMLGKRCWANGVCLIQLSNSKYCGASPAMFAPGTPEAELLVGFSQKIDLLVYSVESWPLAGIKAVRSW